MDEIDERFLIVRKLGEGGFGVVYEAEDRRWGQRVALKRLRSTEAPLLRRFRKEFRAFVELAHPNLVRLYELFALDGRAFFTMELIDGPPVDQWVGGDVARARAALRQLAGGVAALHAAGRLHRDLKPSNLLVGGDGRLRICDAGLVTAVDEALQTPSQHAKGTPVFMSPEQAANRPLSTASDWYGVGAIAYLLVTGRAPFEGGPFAIMRDKLLHEPPPPSEIADVPSDLDRLCVELLRREPERRPPAADILARLGADAPPLPTTTTSEQMALLDAIDAPGVTLLRGDGGAGKSTILAALVARAATRGTVVQLRFADNEQLGARDEIVREAALLALDDVDLADDDSAALLARATAPAIVATAAFEPSPAWRAALANARELTLPPLARQDDASGGNPRLAQLLARHANPFDDAPPSLARAVAAELAELSPEAQALLRLIAAAGAPLPSATLAQAARGFVAQPLSALAELRARHLVRGAGGDRLTVAHPRVAAELRAALTAVEREACERRLRPLSQPL